jgi:hypothetical protein
VKELKFLRGEVEPFEGGKLKLLSGELNLLRRKVKLRGKLPPPSPGGSLYVWFG